MPEKHEKYKPFTGERGQRIEDRQDYIRRMQGTLLPNWPDEVLAEWLHEEFNSLRPYAFLFDKLSFARETWPVSAIPGQEAFEQPIAFETYTSSLGIDVGDLKGTAWLGNYMNENGTWNTPIVLLHNPVGAVRFPIGRPLKSPYHLLEGHRRLSFLNVLRRMGKALPTHDVWVARVMG